MKLKNLIYFVILISLLKLLSCDHLDYALLKPHKLDPKTVNSQLEVIVRDDSVVRHGRFPSLYLYVYIDGYLIGKNYAALNKKNRFSPATYYGHLSIKKKIKSGSHRLKIIYRTYRKSKSLDLIFEEKFDFSEKYILRISYNKDFKVEKINL